MTFPLQELRNLLNRPLTTDGVVSYVGDGVVRVATAKGITQARFSGYLIIGDKVRVEGGVAYKLTPPTRTYSV